MKGTLHGFVECQTVDLDACAYASRADFLKTILEEYVNYPSLFLIKDMIPTLRTFCLYTVNQPLAVPKHNVSQGSSVPVIHLTAEI